MLEQVERFQTRRDSGQAVASVVGQESEKTAMRFWRISTDSEKNDIERTCDTWYRHQMAFSGDYENNPRKHCRVMDNLTPGDGIFMHHKGFGIVGYGVVENTWDGVSYTEPDNLLYKKPQREEHFEYRIKVAWDVSCDCRENPLPILGRLHYRGTYCEVRDDNNRWNVSAILQELRELTSVIQ
jgi:hypothetical protein